jgi:hypothetical protein
MRSKVTTQPTIEPVTLTELKASLRVTSNAEDALLTQYITDARLIVERITGRKLITQTITAYYTGLGGTASVSWWSGTRIGSENQLYGNQLLELEFTPVQSVTSLDAVETDNSETAIASSEYYLDNYDDDMRPVIRPVSFISSGSRDENNVKAVYVAGYGSNASDVPSAIRRAIVVLAGKLYETRGDCGESCQAGLGLNGILEPYIIKNA